MCVQIVKPLPHCPVLQPCLLFLFRVGFCDVFCCEKHIGYLDVKRGHSKVVNSSHFEKKSSAFYQTFTTQDTSSKETCLTFKLSSDMFNNTLPLSWIFAFLSHPFLQQLVPLLSWLVCVYIIPLIKTYSIA